MPRRAGRPSSPCRTAFGAEMRSTRERNGYTLSSVASMTGFSISYVSQLEHGERLPSCIDTVMAIAAALNCPAEPLIRASVEAAGRVVLSAEVSSVGRECAFVLSEVWHDLSDEQFAELTTFLRRWRRNHAAE